MTKTIIDRYKTTDTNKAIIDVSVKTVEHLYHDFDKTAPYYCKELDQEFVDYLSKCVEEIGKHPFVIHLSLEQMPDEKLKERVLRSLNNYYVYLKEIEIQAMKLMFRKFIILFSVGVVLLVLAIVANRGLSTHRGVTAEVFAQGLTIAAWVSLWEAFVNIFMEWQPHRDKIQLYNRIIDSRIIFRSI